MLDDHNGKIHQPLCSSNLTSLDFYLWSDVESVVYTEDITSIEYLQKNVEYLQNNCISNYTLRDEHIKKS